MKILPTIAAMMITAAASGFSPLFAQVSTPSTPSAGCAPMGGLNFICGVVDPEDETPIPGTRWLIASGFKAGEGVKLVDTNAKTEKLFYNGGADQQRPDRKLFPSCPAPPDIKTFRSHGIYLRRQADKRYNLYVISHGALEAVQVFSVDVAGAEPSLTWIGCVPTPAGYSGNAVAAYSDGTILVTVSDRPGTTKVQELAGLPTGNILEWKPGQDAFHVLPGAEMAGNNGLEISLDESEFYVVGFGSESVGIFSRKDPEKPLRETVAPGFMPDNLRWSGDRLIVAGTMYDEPACGGTRLKVAAGGGVCNRGYMVAQLDPISMTWTILAYAEPNPELGGIATGVIEGDTLYIGATSEPGLAYRPLPHPPANGTGGRGAVGGGSATGGSR